MENNCVPKDKKFVPVIESKLRKKNSRGSKRNISSKWD